MKRISTALLVLAIPTGSFADDMSVSDFLRNRNKATTIEYVAGMGEGMDFLNYRAQRLGRDPLFCTPSALKLNATNFMNILESQITSDPKKYSGLMPLANVMVDGLLRTFPCK